MRKKKGRKKGRKEEERIKYRNIRQIKRSRIKERCKGNREEEEKGTTMITRTREAERELILSYCYIMTYCAQPVHDN